LRKLTHRPGPGAIPRACVSRSPRPDGAGFRTDAGEIQAGRAAARCSLQRFTAPKARTSPPQRQNSIDPLSEDADQWESTQAQPEEPEGHQKRLGDSERHQHQLPATGTHSRSRSTDPAPIRCGKMGGQFNIDVLENARIRAVFGH
jgi:hypothetical protein